MSVSSGITIGLGHQDISVDEGDGVIQVCASVISGELERDLIINFSTRDDTAVGKIHCLWVASFISFSAAA